MLTGEAAEGEEGATPNTEDPLNIFEDGPQENDSEADRRKEEDGEAEAEEEEEEVEAQAEEGDNGKRLKTWL